MTSYVADHETGSPLCPGCASGEHPRGWCGDELCQCLCGVERDRAAQLDDRPDPALDSLARDIAAESRPAVLDLHAERYGDHRTLSAERRRRR